MTEAPESAFPTPLVEVEWLRAHLDDVIVVDVRWYIDGRSGHDAYTAGHLPGAVWADLDTDLSAPPAQPGGRHPLPTAADFAAAMGRLGIGDDTRVVCYDDASGGIAARLWWMLDALGHQVSVLNGGVAAWSDSGATLEVGERHRSPAVFTMRPWPLDRLVDADDVAAAIDAGQSVLLDARNHERFRGDANAIDPRFGHIPTARSAPWTANIDTGTGRLQSPDALADRYADLGVAAGTEVIAYCGSGVTACNNVLALRLTGVSAALYVGSWSEWGADPTRPLEAG